MNWPIETQIISSPTVNRIKCKRSHDHGNSWRVHSLEVWCEVLSSVHEIDHLVTVKWFRQPTL